MTTSYNIEWRSSALREIKRFDKSTIKKIIDAIELLSENPHPQGSKKLIGSEHSWRIRIGDYRVVYEIFNKTLIIEIVRIGHRKEIYKR